MISVLIDPSPEMKSPANWTGEVGFVLGGNLYVDLSGALSDDNPTGNLDALMDDLISKIISVCGSTLNDRFGDMSAPVAPAATVSAGDAVASAGGSGGDMLPLKSLSISQVTTLLNGIGYSKYSAAMAEEEIDGSALYAVESADDLKELGVKMALKARSLYDKLQDFKAVGVSVDLVAGPSAAAAAPPDAAVSQPAPLSAPAPSSASASGPSAHPDYPFPKTELQLHGQFTSTMLDHFPVLKDMHTVFKFPFAHEGDTSDFNDPSKNMQIPKASFVHAVHGLFADGKAYEEIKGTNNYGLLAKGPCHSLNKKHFIFATSFAAYEQRDATVLVFGGISRRWFGLAVETSGSNSLSITLDNYGTCMTVKHNDEPVVVSLATWHDVAVHVDMRNLLIEVLFDDLVCDPVRLGGSFADYDICNVPDYDDNTICFTDFSCAETFAGYMKNWRLYSIADEAAEEEAEVEVDQFAGCKPDKDPDELYEKNQVCIENDMGASSMTKMFHFPFKGTKECDVTGEEMKLPAEIVVDKDTGLPLKADYYGDYQAVVSVRELNKRHYVFATSFAVHPKEGWDDYLGVGGYGFRWFALKISSENLYITFNNGRLQFPVTHNGTNVWYDVWYDVAVQVDAAHAVAMVSMNGNTLDNISITDEVAKKVEEIGDFNDNDMMLVNPSNGGMFRGLIRNWRMYSKKL